MRYRRWLTAIAMVTLGTIPAFPKTQTGVLQVSVRVPGTLAPIPGAQVSLLPQENLPPGVHDLPDEENLFLYLVELAMARGINFDDVTISTSNSPMSGSSAVCSAISRATSTVDPSGVLTDTDGNAVLRNLAPGSFRVSARRAGYARILPTGSLATQAPATDWSTVVVNPQGPPAEVSLFLNPAPSIRGRVRNSKGDPIASACVLLGRLQSQNGRTTFFPGAQTLTSATGEYRIQSLSPGEYAVRVQRSPSSPDFLYFPGTSRPESAQVVSVKAGSDTLEINLDLP